MNSTTLVWRDVTFAYETSTEPIFSELQLGVGSGWTGIIGANGAGKTTLLRLAVGELKPLRGQITVPNRALYCVQRTDDPPEDFARLLTSTDPLACRTRGALGLREDWDQRWPSLSHGERKRAQIAVALWREPDLLAVDEPTNHLDGEARRVLADALDAYRGIGLLVSHDRELLDRLCQQCLFLEPPGAILRAGGYTQAMEQLAQEDLAARRQRRQAISARKKIEREYKRRQQAAQQADRKRSKRGIRPKDHDAKAKVDAARVTGKDAVAGKLMRQLEGRMEQARAAQARARVRQEHELGIWLPGSCSPRRMLVHVTGGRLPLGEERALDYPALAIGREDRIALTGPNGGGKSTLVRHLLTRQEIPAQHLTYIPQEIGLARTRAILAQARALPSDRLGHVMMVVSRLNSRPERLLESEVPSPGEIRKLLLALHISQEPHLIIMDEPTNHMDLPSIECLEVALRACPCALLLVSHDDRFLNALTRTHWRISPEPDDPARFRLAFC